MKFLLIDFFLTNVQGLGLWLDTRLHMALTTKVLSRNQRNNWTPLTCIFLFSGRQYDKNGNLKQWWNNATIMAFRDRAQCIIDQYSRYKVNEVGMYMNGKLTQSENIADNGGLKQAFRVKRTVYPHCPQIANIKYSLDIFRLTKNGPSNMEPTTIYLD